MVLTALNPLQEEKRRSRHETKPKAAALSLLVILVFQSKASFAGKTNNINNNFTLFQLFPPLSQVRRTQVCAISLGISKKYLLILALVLKINYRRLQEENFPAHNKPISV